MPNRRDLIQGTIFAACGALLPTTSGEARSRAQPQAPPARRNAEPLLTAPANVPSGPLEISVLHLRLEPGSTSRPHRHPGPVAGYVVAGSVIVEVKGQPPRTYAPGEAFVEPFESIHQRFENPSKSETTEVIAFLIGPAGQPVAMPVK